MYKRMTTGLAAAFVALTALSCSTTKISSQPALVPLQGKQIKSNLGKVKTSNSAVSIFGIYMAGSPDINMAVDKALNMKKADTLINVNCYETWKYFLLFSISSCVIEAEAVTLEESLTAPAPARRKK